MSTLAEISRYYCGRTEPVERNTDTTSRRRIVHQVSLRSVERSCDIDAVGKTCGRCRRGEDERPALLQLRQECGGNAPPRRCGRGILGREAASVRPSSGSRWWCLFLADSTSTSTPDAQIRTRPRRSDRILEPRRPRRSRSACHFRRGGTPHCQCDFSGHFRPKNGDRGRAIRRSVPQSAAR